ncbi:MAG: GNAT family N-acetyltransferase [Candidatus Eremiobacteraeota bacterium]|nr:GNAT family N-acetyltransferase [Candidatus Eremiobacteraeota bacterium]MCW5866660.1 GNAT family N-acetyltransferase [Candidatus Eremiobacteraeota bacterium]
MALSFGPPTDLTALELLQQRVWGCSANEIVPAHLLQAHQHHGACVLEARLNGELVGLLYAVPGPLGSDYLYSHLAAITPEMQGRGYGRQLKLTQASWARERGYRRIVWTFDPLQVLNARLNISRLGAVCNRYLVDYYGELDDELNRGVPTDRFEVDWWLSPVERGPVTETVTFELGARSRESTRHRFLDSFARGLSVISFEVVEGRGIYGLGVVHAP